MPAGLSRTYVGVGLTARGRKGATSGRVSVPLVPPPRPPSSPTISYDEHAVTVTWEPAPSAPAVHGPPGDDELPSRPIGWARPAIAYNVYDAATSTKLTRTPVAAMEFSDPRIVWGERRCYTVRAGETVGGMAIESDAPEPACETLTDTFPPAAPVNVQSSPGEGAISLIWDPNTEKDLAGYLVFRGVAPGDSLQQITPAPLEETTFRDGVQPGTVYVYEVKAVDKAGNVSAPSNRVQETAR
jgi:hypothetical protein